MIPLGGEAGAVLAFKNSMASRASSLGMLTPRAASEAEIVSNETYDVMFRIPPSAVADVRRQLGCSETNNLSALLVLLPAWKLAGCHYYCQITSAALALTDVSASWACPAGGVATLAVPDLDAEGGANVHTCEVCLCVAEPEGVELSELPGGLRPRSRLDPTAIAHESAAWASASACAVLGPAPQGWRLPSRRGMASEESPLPGTKALRRCLQVGNALKCTFVRPVSLRDVDRNLSRILKGSGDTESSPHLFGEAKELVSKLREGDGLQCQSVLVIARAELPRYQLLMAAGDDAKLMEADMPPLCPERPALENGVYGECAPGTTRPECFVRLGETPHVSFKAVAGCSEYLVQCYSACVRAGGGSAAVLPWLAVHPGTTASFSYTIKHNLSATRRPESRLKSVRGKSQARGGESSAEGSPGAADGERVFCELTGVPPGRFRCRVKAKNRNGYGVWSRACYPFHVLEESHAMEQERALNRALEAGDLERLQAMLAQVQWLPLANDLQVQRAREGAQKLDKAAEEVKELMRPSLHGEAQQGGADASLLQAIEGDDLAALQDALDLAEVTPGTDAALQERARQCREQLVCERMLAYGAARRDEDVVAKVLQRASQSGLALAAKADEVGRNLRLKRMQLKVAELTRGADEHQLHALLAQLDTEFGTEAADLKDEVEGAIEAIQIEGELRDALRGNDSILLRKVTARAEIFNAKGFKQVDEVLLRASREECLFQEEEDNYRAVGREVLVELLGPNGQRGSSDSAICTATGWSLGKKVDYARKLLPELIQRITTVHALQKIIQSNATAFEASFLQQAHAHLKLLQHDEALHKAVMDEDIHALRELLPQHGLDMQVHEKAQTLLRRLELEDNLLGAREEEVLRELLHMAATADDIQESVVEVAHRRLLQCERVRWGGILKEAIAKRDLSAMDRFADLPRLEHYADLRRSAAAHAVRAALEIAMEGDDTQKLRSAITAAKKAHLDAPEICIAELITLGMHRFATLVIERERCSVLAIRRAREHLKELKLIKELESDDRATVQAAFKLFRKRGYGINDPRVQRAMARIKYLCMLEKMREVVLVDDLAALKDILLHVEGVDPENRDVRAAKAKLVRACEEKIAASVYQDGQSDLDGANAVEDILSALELAEGIEGVRADLCNQGGHVAAIRLSHQLRGATRVEEAARILEQARKLCHVGMSKAGRQRAKELTMQAERKRASLNIQAMLKEPSQVGLDMFRKELEVARQLQIDSEVLAMAEAKLVNLECLTILDGAQDASSLQRAIDHAEANFGLATLEQLFGAKERRKRLLAEEMEEEIGRQKTDGASRRRMSSASPPRPSL